MSNSIAPGSSADVNIRVTALTTNPNVPVTYKTIILKKNLVNGVNTLTQEMMSTTNTKYIIKYNYVLGENITAPANCILEFDGGSVRGSHTVTFNQTALEGNVDMVGITAAGTILNVEGHIKWFNTTGDTVNGNLQFLVNNCQKTVIDNGIWFISYGNPIILRSDIEIYGESQTNSIIKCPTSSYTNQNYTLFSTYPIIIANWSSDPEYWHNVTPSDNKKSNIIIKNIRFDLNRHPEDFPSLTTKDVAAINLENARNCIIERCDFIDYMTSEKNNGSNCVHFTSSINCKCSGCYTENVTFIFDFDGNSNEVSHCVGERSIGTWIDNGISPNMYIHDNRITDLIWGGISMISVNSKSCIIENNIVIHKDSNVDNFGINCSHSESISESNLTTIRGNQISLNSGIGITVQNSFIVRIENNYVESLSVSGVLTGVFCTSDCRGVVIDGNIINVTNIGIDCRAQKLVSVSNNVIKADGIALQSLNQSCDIKVFNNIFERTTTTDYCCDIRGIVVNVQNNKIIGQPFLSVDKLIFVNNIIDISEKGPNFSYMLIQVYTNDSKIIPIIANNSIKLGTYDVTYIFALVSNYFFDNITINGYLDIARCIYNNQIDGEGSYTELLDITNNSSNKPIKKEILKVFTDQNDTLNAYTIGNCVFNKTLGKPCWWNGTDWVDATGTSV